MQPELKPYKPEHFFMVDGRELKPTDEHRAVAQFYYDHSFFGSEGRSAFTAFDGDKALGCAGVVILPSGKGEVWMHLSSDLARQHLWLTKTAFMELIDVIRASGVKPVECFIPVTKKINRNWIARLGFQDIGPRAVRGEWCRHYEMRGVS